MFTVQQHKDLNLINKICSELSKMFLFQLKVETYLGVLLRAIDRKE